MVNFCLSPEIIDIHYRNLYFAVYKHVNSFSRDSNFILMHEWNLQKIALEKVEIFLLRAILPCSRSEKWKCRWKFLFYWFLHGAADFITFLSLLRNFFSNSSLILFEDKKSIYLKNFKKIAWICSFRRLNQAWLRCHKKERKKRKKLILKFIDLPRQKTFR